MPTTTSFAELTRLCRYELSLSQREFAALVGTSSARISAYESGKRQPTVEAANQIFHAIGLRVVLATEPVDAELDRRIEQLASEPIGNRLLKIKPHVLTAVDFLSDAEPMLDGAAAALIHGVPVPVEFT